MNKSNLISAKLTKLENEAANLFSDLLKEHKEFNFLQELSDYEGTDEEIKEQLEETCEFELLPTLPTYNDITGNTFDIRILKVDENGLHGIKADYDVEPYNIKFSELADLESRLVLLNEMEELING